MCDLTEISGAEQHLTWRSGAQIPFPDVLAHAEFSPKTTCGVENRINELVGARRAKLAK